MHSIEELQTRLDEITKQLKGGYLRYAIEVAKCDGRTHEQCYIDAGYSANGARANSSKTWQRQSLIREYVDVAKLMAMCAAQEELEYDEKRWLADVLEAVDMAMGRKKIQVVSWGKQEELCETNLAAASRLLDQLGKKLGIFTENRNIGLTPENPLSSLMRKIQEEAKAKGPLSE